MAAVDLGSIAATACAQGSLALEGQSVEGRGGLRTGALGLRRQPWGGAPEPLCWRLRKPDCGFRGCGGGRLGLLPLQKGSSGLRAGPSPCSPPSSPAPPCAPLTSYRSQEASRKWGLGTLEEGWALWLGSLGSEFGIWSRQQCLSGSEVAGETVSPAGPAEFCVGVPLHLPVPLTSLRLASLVTRARRDLRGPGGLFLPWEKSGPERA